MPMKALCFLLVLLAGCAAHDEATPLERDLVARAERAQACSPASLSGTRSCNLYLLLNDRRIATLVEVRRGIPYVALDSGGEPERYAFWYAQMSRNGVSVRQYVGCCSTDYYTLMYAHMGQAGT